MPTTTKTTHTPKPVLVIYDTGGAIVFEQEDDGYEQISQARILTDGNVSVTVIPLTVAAAAPALVTALEHGVTVLRDMADRRDGAYSAARLRADADEMARHFDAILAQARGEGAKNVVR